MKVFDQVTEYKEEDEIMIIDIQPPHECSCTEHCNNPPKTISAELDDILLNKTMAPQKDTQGENNAIVTLTPQSADCPAEGDVEDIELDAQLKTVQRDIKEVESFLHKLNERKQNLLEKYDGLKERKILRKSLNRAKENWSKDSFPWIRQNEHILKDTFKLTEFRHQQLQTINAVLSKTDVILLAPTGGGKSLCYQLPAVSQKGITICVSPLLALMEDQVWALKKLGVEADLLCSTTDRNKNNSILKALSETSEISKLKILYVTPERMAKSKRFQTALQKSYFAKKLDLIAIDEVHCCSQWGHDFRPDYKFLGSLKTMYPDVPILGVTATATSKVIIDVQKMLNIRDCLVFKAPFNRPNLYYQVIEKPTEKLEVYKLIENLLKGRYAGKSGIIYTFSIKDAEDLSVELMKRDIQARPYHANLDASRRTKVHTKWLNGSIQVVVATVAFGMGIDKPDVRFVIHHTLSKSMENFYQESGRAGRDGKRAECVMLYRFADIAKITTMMFTERTGLRNAYSMVEYCINGTRCRRDIISEHFTEVWSDNDCGKMCDRCFHIDRINPPQMNISQHCLDLYRIIENCEALDIKVTGNKLIDAWYHKGATNLRYSAIKPPAIDRYYAEQVIAYLLANQYLKEDFHFTAYQTISYIKRGSNSPKESRPILFHGARILSLPGTNNLWDEPVPTAETSTNDFLPPTSTNTPRSASQRRRAARESDDDVQFVSEKKLKKKKHKRSSSSKSSASSSSSSKRHKRDHSSDNDETTPRSHHRRTRSITQEISSDGNESTTSTVINTAPTVNLSKQLRLTPCCKSSDSEEACSDNEDDKEKIKVSKQKETLAVDDLSDDVLLVQDSGTVIEIDD